jgi:lipoprotein signal peptidase
MPRSYRWLLWGLVVFGLTVDQGTKYGVFAWLGGSGHGGEYVVVPNMFELTAEFKADGTPHVNQGALFGLGNTHGALANGIFAAVSVIAAIAIAYWSTLPATIHDGSLCAALGLILAGTLGNLYDRIVFQGVRDFIHWHYYQHDWPVFNIADCCLVCGAGLLLTQAFFAKPATVQEDALALAGSPEMAEAK